MTNPPHRKSRRKASGRGPKKVRPTALRIIGGEMRGRTVLYHGAGFTRPMKDNVRENLFNILGPAVRGSICFDLFAGTGAMAFESLSRGARFAVIIEQNRQAVRFIQRTAESLDVTSRIRLLTGDTFRLAAAVLAPPEDDTPWVVFLCPPYALWQQSLAEMNRVIQMALNNAPPGSIVVAETETSFEPKQLAGQPWEVRDYGGTRLALIRPAMRCGMSL